jgi:hypothetical protein
MAMLCGPILAACDGKPENPAGLLLRCLPSLVFHSDALLEVMVKHPGHDFAKISILHDRELLDGLKKLMTTDPTPEVMTVATGMPPHMGMALHHASWEDSRTSKGERTMKAKSCC